MRPAGFYPKRLTFTTCHQGHWILDSACQDVLYRGGVMKQMKISVEMGHRSNQFLTAAGYYRAAESRNLAKPICASSATALARVGEAFNDSGRSSRIPSWTAYSRKRISTS